MPTSPSQFDDPIDDEEEDQEADPTEILSSTDVDPSVEPVPFQPQAPQAQAAAPGVDMDARRAEIRRITDERAAKAFADKRPFAPSGWAPKPTEQQYQYAEKAFNDQERKQAMAQRQAEVARRRDELAQKKQYNDNFQKEADITGVRGRVSQVTGVYEPIRDAEGRAVFRTTPWAPGEHPESKLPVLQRRGARGETEFKRPNVALKPDDPFDEHLYADIGDGQSIPYIKAADALKSGDVTLQRLGVQHQKRQRTAQRKQEIEIPKAEVANAELELKTAAGEKEFLQGEIQKDNAMLVDLDGKIQQTGGGFLGIGASPTPDALAAQSQYDQISTRIQANRAKATALDSMTKPGGEMHRRHTMAVNNLRVIEPTHKRDEYIDNEQEILTRLQAEGRDPATDPTFIANRRLLEETDRAVQSATVARDRWAMLMAKKDGTLPPPLVPKVEAPTVMGEMAKGVGDVAASFASGTGAAVKMIGDIYGLASGNMQNPVSRFGAEVSEFWDEKKSADFKQLDASRRKAVDAETSELGKAWQYVKNTLSNPTLLAALAAENLPNMVGPGALGALSRVGVAKLLTKRLSEEAAKKLAVKIGVGTAIGAGAVMQGADVASDQYEEMLASMGKMTPAQAQAIPEVASLMEQGATLDDAKLAVALSLARKTFAPAAAVSVASQMLPGARTIEKALVGGVKRQAGKRLVSAVLGGLGETAQEIGEEVGGLIPKNVVAQAVEPGRSPFKDVGQTAAQAGLAGGLMGAAAGAMNVEPGQKPPPGGNPPAQPGGSTRPGPAAPPATPGVTPSDTGGNPVGAPAKPAGPADASKAESAATITSALFGKPANQAQPAAAPKTDAEWSAAKTAPITLPPETPAAIPVQSVITPAPAAAPDVVASTPAAQPTAPGVVPPAAAPAGAETVTPAAAPAEAQSEPIVPAEPAVAQTAPPAASATTEPISEKEFTLNQDLKGAKPRYGYGNKLFNLKFESDLDRALYILAQKNPSKRDADYLKSVLEHTGMTEAEARAAGAKVRERIKGMARTGNHGDELNVPKTPDAKAAPAAAERVAVDDESAIEAQAAAQAATPSTTTTNENEVPVQEAVQAETPPPVPEEGGRVDGDTGARDVGADGLRDDGGRVGDVAPAATPPAAQEGVQAAPVVPEVKPPDEGPSVATLQRHIETLEYRMKQDKARGIKNPNDVARLTNLKAQLEAKQPPLAATPAASPAPATPAPAAPVAPAAPAAPAVREASAGEIRDVKKKLQVTRAMIKKAELVGNKKVLERSRKMETELQAKLDAMRDTKPAAADKGVVSKRIGLPKNGERDILNAIADLGGIAHPDTVSQPGGEYNGFDEATKTGLAQLLVKRDGRGSKPDALLDEIREEGFDFETEQEMYDEIKQAMAERHNDTTSKADESKSDKLARSLSYNEKPYKRMKGATATLVDDLHVGDKMKASGKPVEVVSIDEDGNVTIESEGIQQTIPAGQEIWPDRRTLRKVSREVTDFAPDALEAPAESSPPAPEVKEFSYGLRSRPWSIGAQPKGQTRVDEDDKRARYGVAYYPRELTKDEIQSFELVDLNQPVAPVFSPDDKVIMHSPFTDEDTEVNFRGPMPDGKAMVVPKSGMQMAVPMAWLRAKPAELPTNVIPESEIPFNLASEEKPEAKSAIDIANDKAAAKAEADKQTDMFTAPKPEAPKPAPAPEAPKVEGIEPTLITKENAAEAETKDTIFAVSAAKHHFTLWYRQRMSNGKLSDWRYISTLGGNKEAAHEKAMESARRIGRGDMAGVAFWGKEQFRMPTSIGVFANEVQLSELDPMADRATSGERRVGFGKHSELPLKDLLEKDPGYANWIVDNATHGRMKQVAEWLASTPEFIIAKAESKAKSENVMSGDTAAVLKKFDITATTLPSGMIQLTGKTFDWKDIIKELKGKFSANAWSLPAEGFEKFMAHLRSLGEASGKQPAHVTNPKFGEMRKKSDALPDESALPKPVNAYVQPTTMMLLSRGEKAGMAKFVVQEQIEDVARINRAYQEAKRVFLLASEPGSGKTFVLGGTIRELRKSGAKVIGYVTKNAALIEQIKRDLKDFDIGDVQFFTYDQLRGTSTKAAPTPQAFDALIWDESHAIKNLNGEGASKQAKIAAEWIKNSKFTVFSSATPFENPTEVLYLDPTGVFAEPFGSAENFALAHGASLVEIKNKQTGEVLDRYLRWNRGPMADADMKAARNFLQKRGVLTSRLIRLDPAKVDNRLVKMDVAEADKKQYDAFSKAAELVDELPPSSMKGKVKAQVINLQKRLLEAAKINRGIQEAESAIKRGRWPIIFVETKAERNIDIADLEKREEEWSYAVREAQSMRERPPSRKDFGLPFEAQMDVYRAYQKATGESVIHIPSAEDVITNYFGDGKTLIYTGSLTDSKAQKNLQQWRESKTPTVLVVTMAKGGTGLSLHDKVGDHQTTQININLPWSATQVVQVAQRSARYGLQGKAEMMWIFADNVGFDRALSSRVGGRMATMGALVQGQELAGAKNIEDFDFTDLSFSQQNKVDAKAALTDSMQEPYGLEGDMTEEQLDSYLANRFENVVTGDFDGTALESAQAEIAAFQAENPKAPKVNVIHDPSWIVDGRGVRGMYLDGVLTVNSAYSTNPAADAHHEWAHHTLASNYGKVALAAFATREIPADEMARLASKYPRQEGQSVADHRLELVEEWIAENEETRLGIWQRIVESIRGWLSRQGLVNLTNDEAARAMIRVLRGAPAPEGGGPGSMFALTKRVRFRRSIGELTSLAKDQEAFHNWYSDFKSFLDDYLGKHKSSAPLIAELLAATSAATSVQANVPRAVKALREFIDTGAFLSVRFGAHRANLNRAAAGEKLLGPKISEYSDAIFGNENAMAIDRHISQIMFGTVKPSNRQIIAAKSRIVHIAQRLGWTPRQAQAALWAANVERTGKTVQSYEAHLNKYRDIVLESLSADRAGEGRGAEAAKRIARRISEGRRAARSGGRFALTDEPVTKESLVSQSLKKVIGSKVEEMLYDERSQKERFAEAEAIVSKNGRKKAEQMIGDPTIPRDTQVAIAGVLLRDAANMDGLLINRIARALREKVSTESGQAIAMHGAIYRDLAGLSSVVEVTKRIEEEQQEKVAPKFPGDPAAAVEAGITAAGNEATDALNEILTKSQYKGIVGMEPGAQGVASMDEVVNAMHDILINPAFRGQNEKVAKKMLESEHAIFDLMKKIGSELGVKWSEMFQSMPRNQEERQAHLYAKIKEHLKLQNLTDAQAKFLAERVGNAWEQLRNNIIRAEFKRLIPLPQVAPQDAKKVETVIDKLIRYSNSGLLDNTAFVNALADKYGIKTMDGPVVAKLKDLAKRVQEETNPAQKARLQLEMLQEYHKAKGVSRADYWQSLMYANILSGYTTLTGGMAVPNVLNSMWQLATMALSNPKHAATLAKGYGAGFSEGIRQFRSILASGHGGQDPAAMAAESQGDALEMMARGEIFEKLQKAFPMVHTGMQYHAKVMRYVGRLVRAIDAMAYYPAREAYSWAATEQLLQSKYSGAELHNKVQETLGIRPGDFAKFQKQAEAEGFTGHDLSRRISDLIEEHRKSTEVGMVSLEEGKRFGLGTTLSGEPEGWAGVVYQHVSSMVNKVTPGGVPVLKPFFMFLRVPTNFYNLTMNATPWGAVKAFSGSTITTERKGGKYVSRKFSEDEKHQLYVQAAIGTALMGYLAAKAMGDDDDKKVPLLNASGPRDPQARAQWQANGGIPYSIRLPGTDTLVSYQNWPIAVPLAIAAHVSDSLRYDDTPDKVTFDRIVDACLRFPSVIFGAPVLNGLSQLADLTNAYRPSTKKAEMFLLNLGTSTVMPRLLKQLDATFREDRVMDGGVVRYDSLGEPVRWAPYGRMISTQDKTPLRKWLNEARIIVPTPGRDVKIDGEKHKLTDEQYSNLERVAGGRTRIMLQGQLGVLRSMPRDEAEKEVRKIAEENIKNVRDLMKITMTRK